MVRPKLIFIPYTLYDETTKQHHTKQTKQTAD